MNEYIQEENMIQEKEEQACGVDWAFEDRAVSPVEPVWSSSMCYLI
jgi:hypothetical protein